MASKDGGRVLTGAQWAVLEPLMLVVRLCGKTPHEDLRRTMEAIIWRHRNGAAWRAVPAALGTWWGAAQAFVRWGRRAVSMSPSARACMISSMSAARNPGLAFARSATVSRKLRVSGIAIPFWLEQCSKTRR